MHKKLMAALAIVGMLLVTGCGNEESKTMTCTRTATVTAGVDMDLNYKVTYKGDYVLMVESEEKVTSEDKDYLETYETTVKNMYSPYDNVEHYNYDVKIEGDTLISSTKIDYEKIDTNKLIEIDSANGTLIKNGKIKLNDIKSAYESVGATCN